MQAHAEDNDIGKKHGPDKLPATNILGIPDNLTWGEPGPLTSNGHPPPQAQASQLGEASLHSVQRREIAANIGQAHGNQYLQRVIEGLGGNGSGSMLARPESGVLAQVDTSGAKPGTANANPTVEKAGTPDRRYNLTIGTDVLENVGRDDALRVLWRHYRRIEGWLNAEEEAYQYQQQIRDDQPVVGFFSDLLGDGFIGALHGGIEMPSGTMYMLARATLVVAQSTLELGKIDESVMKLTEAETHYVHCHQTLRDYVQGTMSGADRSITVLRVTEAAGAVAATVATGGLAAEAELGLVATSGVVGATAGGYGMTQELYGQAAEIDEGLRKNFDAGAILRRGAKDAVVGFVGALTGGALTSVIKSSFGSYLSKAVDDGLLAELGEQAGLGGPMPRDFLLTKGQQFFAEFVSGVGTAPLTTAVSVSMNRLIGGGPVPKSLEEFVDTVVGDMVKGGGMQLFMGAFIHAHGASGDAGGASPTYEPTVFEPHPFEFSQTAPSGLEPVTPAPAEFPIPEVAGEGLPPTDLGLGSNPIAENAYEPHQIEFGAVGPTSTEFEISGPTESPTPEAAGKGAPAGPSSSGDDPPGGRSGLVQDAPVKHGAKSYKEVPTTGKPGNRRSSVRDRTRLGLGGKRGPKELRLPKKQQEMVDELANQHPGLDKRTADQATRGAKRVKPTGKGSEGPDVELQNGKLREVFVFTGEFAKDNFVKRLINKSQIGSADELYVQINSSEASSGIIRQWMMEFAKQGDVNVSGKFVKVFGPNGDAWWFGTL